MLAGPPLAHLSSHPAAAAAAVGSALPGSPGRSDSALAEEAQEACGPLQEESKEESGEARVRGLTERELVALAAREESAPSKVPRSAKKKEKREAERAANPASGAGGGAASNVRGAGGAPHAPATGTAKHKAQACAKLGGPCPCCLPSLSCLGAQPCSCALGAAGTRLQAL